MERHLIFPTQDEFEDSINRLHPSLRDGFVSLPGGESMLTLEQLDAVFGGDRRALRDMVKLIFQMPETDHNIVG